MFSLIIAIISIALVVAAVALGAYYGGSSISEAEAQAQAARLKNEEQQIIAAVDSFQADQGRWPADIQELVSRGYLNSVPRGAPEASLGQTAVEFIAWAHAQEAVLGWSTPVAGVPIYTTSHSVAQEVCRKYNSASRGDDGILKNAFTGLKSQCFGEDGEYAVVITRAASASSLSSALPAAQVSEGDIPTADAGTVWWDVAPSGAIKVPTDPAKVPRATLELHPATAEDFGELQVGDITAAESRTVINSGNTSALGLQVTVPDGFSLSSNSCSTELASHGSCSFTVQFQPSSAAPYSGTVTVVSTNGGTQAFSVSGSGRGASAALSNIDFGNQAASTITDLTSILSNTGIGALTLTPPTAASVTGSGFSFVSTTCGSSLAAGGTCTTTVRYTPSGVSSASGQLTISTGAGSKVATLSGQSTASAATLTSASAVTLADWYSNGGTKTASLTYRNDGNVAMTLATPSLSAPLSITANTCSSVAAGASCSMTVKLALDGVNGGSSSQTITPSGASTAPSAATVNWAIYTAVPSWSTTTLAFGNVAVGQSSSKTITLTNKGSVAVNWASNSTLANLPANFTANTSACSNVAPAGSCTVTVTYSPTAATSQSVPNISMAYASYSENTFTVSGTGTAATYSASQFALVSYGQYGVDDLYWTIKNNTGSNVTVTAITFSGFDEYAGITINGVSYAVSEQYGGTQKITATSTWPAGATYTLGMDQAEATITLHLSNGQALTFNVSWSG